MICRDTASGKTNIVDRNDFSLAKKDVINLLSEVVSRSLGPYGATTVIRNQMMNHQITKDGYTILNNIYIDDPDQRTIADIIRKISRNLVRKVGDGSTSAVVVANALYTRLNEVINNYKESNFIISPREIIETLEHISVILNREIRKISVPIKDGSDPKIFNVATVALNNNPTYGRMISDIYSKIGHSGFITMEKSFDEKTYYEIGSGFEIFSGYLTHSMCNTLNHRQSVHDQCAVIMVDDMLNEEHMEALGEFIQFHCITNNNSLCIIAKHFSNGMVQFFNKNITLCRNNRRELPLLAIDIAYDSKNDKENFNDLAIFLGATPYRLSEGDNIELSSIENRLGRCEQVVSSNNNTKFIGSGGDPDTISKLIEQLRREKAELAASETYIVLDKEIVRYDRRINRMSSSMARIFVGGESEEEKDSKIYLFDDAVFACKSAIEFGCNIGGNLIIPILLNNHNILNEIHDLIYYDDRLFNKLNNKDRSIAILDFIKYVELAFRESYKTVLSNAMNDNDEASTIVEQCVRSNSIYNLLTREYEDAKDTTIINSSETDIEILNACFSIVGLLVTSNQILILPSELG